MDDMGSIYKYKKMWRKEDIERVSRDVRQRKKKKRLLVLKSLNSYLSVHRSTA